MDGNSSNGENTNPGYVPPSHASPLFDEFSPFFNVENTYQPVFPELNQGDYTPFSATYPQAPSELNQRNYTPFTITGPLLPETHQESYTPFSITYPQVPPERNQESYTPTNVTYPPIRPEMYHENCTPFSITYPPMQSETHQENYSQFSTTYPPMLPETHQGNFTPFNVNPNSYPANVFKPIDLPLATGQPNNYFLDTVMDTSAIISRANFRVQSEHSKSQAGSRDLRKAPFRCKKCPAEFNSSHAFGGHMSHHAKLAKKFENPQTMMAALDESRYAESISAMNEGFNESLLPPQKKRDRKKGKGVVIDESNVKRQA